ncbi:esterase family protein [candidate division KSB1 bacterium]|nr:esterase family protein [candidate division KSB1 bacterium]
MHREHHQWYSPSLGREMDLLLYGHYGRPLLVFPSARGRYFEYEDFSMIETLAPFIDAGKIKVFCPDGNDWESWFNYDVHPSWRARRHNDYQSYIINEVVPFVRQHCQSSAVQMAGTGVSFGAYHALNFALKFPHEFSHVIAMSGNYDVRERVFGYYDDEVYFNSPKDYLPGIHDHTTLEQIRRIKIALVVGQGAWEGNCIDGTIEMSRLLDAKAISHHLSLWGHEWPHDWPTWRAMIRHYVSVME